MIRFIRRLVEVLLMLALLTGFFFGATLGIYAFSGVLHGRYGIDGEIEGLIAILIAVTSLGFFALMFREDG